jgi:hypothetical protein
MEITEFANKYLELTDVKVLEVYHGYLIAGKYKKEPLVFWINKQNIEGLTEVVKILAIETAFKGILSFIPGGSFAYQLIMDQIGYPPRFNVVFNPEMYEITYSLIALDQKGKPRNIVDSLAQNVDSMAKTALKTGEKIHDSIRGLITPKKPKEYSQSDNDKDFPLGFTYIRFVDRVSLIRNEIIEKRIQYSRSKTGKTTTKLASELAPPIIISYKTTANEEAIVFLTYLRSIGFKIRFSQKLDRTEKS